MREHSKNRQKPNPAVAVDGGIRRPFHVERFLATATEPHRSAAIEYNKLHNTNMKKLIVTTFLVASSVILLSGCISANCHRNAHCCRATLGQQLLDLKTAQGMGAITEEEFQTLKAKLIGNK
jgi:hypothetical protein